MSEVQMAHPSAPGYHGIALDEALRQRLAAVADLMIPATDTFPSGGDVVPTFVQERISAVEVEALRKTLDEIGDPSVGSIRNLEESSADAFAELRAWVYRGYYGSSLVASLMQHYGSRYHGAPQPLGYVVEKLGPVPVTVRGSYLTTEEVRHVEL